MDRPERPRLRPVNVIPFEHRGKQLVALRDPSGFSTQVAALPIAGVTVLSLCDGSSTRDEICAEWQRRHGAALPRGVLDLLLTRLDEALLLASGRFRAHFDQLEVRPAQLAGHSYPHDPGELERTLAAMFTLPGGPGPPGPRSGRSPRAIIAPHIDFPRGGAAYGWAYHGLATAATLPDLVVVFGTDHRGIDQPFSLTRKHYDTPLGRIDTDVNLVDELVARAGQSGVPAEQLFRDEPHHLDEHSLEFQMVWLRYVLGDRAAQVRVLPVLCGSLQRWIDRGLLPGDTPEVRVLLDEIARVTADRDTLFVAGADLAHVGPQFGDTRPLEAPDRSALERRDRADLAGALGGDANAWFRAVAADRDQRRVCGLSPIYALLHTARPRRGAVLDYGQRAADEAGGSLVSIAAVVYPE